MTTIAKRLGAAYPDADGGFTAFAQPFVDAYIGPQPRQLLFTMLGAVFFVLLIACANVANLLLDRAAHRTKEVGIRTALGASRSAVIRQFLAEALLLSLMATVFGIVVAYAGVAAFNSAILVTNVPFFIDIRLHPPVLASPFSSRSSRRSPRARSPRISRRAPISTKFSRTNRAARRASASAASARRS